MTPEQLITFSVVADLKNISRAAEALHLSQPAVSGQLKLLQERFGEPLYVREGRGIRLTGAGLGLLDHARKLRADLNEALAYRDSMRGVETGHLHLGASTTVMNYFLPYLIADFGERHPKIKVSVSAGNTHEIVEKLHELDLGFVEGPVSAAEIAPFEIRAWQEDEVVAVMRRDHPLASRKSASLEAVQNYPLISREAGSGVRQLVENAYRERGLETRAVLELTGVEAVKEAIRAGMGISFISSMSLRHGDPLLKGISIDPPLRRMLSLLLPPKERRSRVAELFSKLCL